MYYIQKEPNESGYYGNPMGEPFSDCIEMSNEFLTEYIDANGFVNITIENGAVTSIEKNAKAWNAWKESLPEPEPSNVPDPAQIQLATNFMLMSCTTYTDEQALQIKYVFAVWPEGVNTDGKYTKGQYITHNEQLYRIEQDVQPIESQPPDAVGMLAVYRPVDVEHAGTLEDPIPWVYGMNCYAGKYYSYNGNTYKVAVGGDMIPCTWYPDSGIWQWELVTGGTEADVEDDVQY